MHVEDIVAKFLRGEGYDGPVNPDCECACGLNDFAPCDDFHVNTWKIKKET